MTGGAARKRVGFLGVGWIGRHRMAAIRDGGAVEVAAIADASDAAAGAALAEVPGARRLSGLDALLDAGLDGLVIATPSAQHAAEAVRALDAGLAVFCQKPLGRNAAETAAAIAAARRADRLLGVDLSYRHLLAAERLRELVASGALGRIHAIDLVFHNAYGPDKPWFFDRALSGGGCVIDLGIHLADLALRMLDFPAVLRVDSRLFAAGRRLAPGTAEVEDHAVATLDLSGGTVVRLSCSWRAHAGRDADISVTVYGDAGGAALRNVEGSFYDFVLERHHGTRRDVLVSPPDSWGGRAAAGWAERLAAASGFDPAVERLAAVAEAIDAIYRGSA